MNLQVLFCFVCLILKSGILQNSAPPIRVEMVTNYGTVILKLYDDTPLHRDNFVKLVKSGTYDSLLFHRIIQNFMVQAGDTQSKIATIQDTLGGNDLNYRVPAEIKPDLFHKKGALGAARTNNRERASSSTQFYIVQGKIQNDSLLTHNENRINQFLASHFAANDPRYQPLQDSIQYARENRDSILTQTLANKWTQIQKNYSDFDRYQIPDAHREIYKSIGGTPHLDQNYTVFGEVESGLEVIDAMAAVETNSMDRPLTEVRILKMRILRD
ncbi:MAG: peptidylprolyl isomerase [Cyclobacteriaceae bacterium]|nr:peptidylprolyl isomerase [Cyclobacteriaceae bacterium]